MIIKISSCDSQGSVYIGDSAVYRPIHTEHIKNITDVLNIVGEGISGIIETTVCRDEDLPVGLRGISELTLQHRKVAYVSYPHEWCASMLKDAAIFHLELLEKLLSKRLTLKDAHPWNILFDRGRPVFVDFTSIVTEKGLFNENYLEANRKFRNSHNTIRAAQLVREIFARMFQPYFLNPLLMYAYGERDRVRPRIENTTLNASSETIALSECFTLKNKSLRSLRKYLSFLATIYREKVAYSRLKNRFSLIAFYTDMRHHVQCLSVAASATAYASYYKEKGENHDWNYCRQWNEKQKGVHDALNIPSIDSVLDVACNTGWYALMAERLGKKVVAFDIDEGCIDILYQHVNRDCLNILPLVLSFTDLTQDKCSIYDDSLVLINAGDRLRSDAVLALGIIHHLVLGLGMSLEEVLNSLQPLFKERLILEFINADDAMICNEPSFFPAYFNNSNIINGYDIQALISLINSRGFEVKVAPSYPDTRKLLICDRLTK
ncbi:class I SAM-dependent methyltransferase [Cyanobium sp. BA5m-21]|uniref:class I SAM-dependent methyltransferase n=1 Tax=unclassified Cyanobium TaxID=2627006 RepID=UPI0020CEB1BA|nr:MULTISPECIES: class I SAM-dependent methyltransferase [unclassified Cyanobium]MCP9903227.1 class I SAM-dependent methyltransferase [Cyanobium sp. BA5m-10]MCP9908030.1 class I SAM-dependent methyltransferase [Cyanobium sp. BA5m-21]